MVVVNIIHVFLYRVDAGQIVSVCNVNASLACYILMQQLFLLLTDGLVVNLYFEYSSRDEVGGQKRKYFIVGCCPHFHSTPDVVVVEQLVVAQGLVV